MSYLVSFAVASLVTGCWLWGVARWSGFVAPTADLVIVVGLCNGLALLPGPGWILAMAILSLLVVKTTEADTWPDAVLMVTGSGLVWAVAYAARMTFMS
jgi:hypothetical protein